MSDPFGPSSDPDIPTPTRENLLPHVHGSVRDQLAAGTLNAKHAENEWRCARRLWEEGHKKEAERRRTAEKAAPKPPPPSGGTRVHGSTRAPTEQERVRDELLHFMPQALREEYKKAGPEQQLVLWEANRQAFENAQSRRAAKLLREQQLTEKILDLLQRLKEDPSKAHFLPPENASMADLHKWFEEMSRPVHNIPFPGEGGYSTTDQDKGVPGIRPRS